MTTIPPRRMVLGSVPLRLLGRDSARAEESSRHDRTEDESTDVCEERNAAATGVPGVHERVVALEELVQEPATEIDPSRDVDRKPQHEGADTRIGIEHDVGAQDGGDRSAGAEIGYLRVGRRAKKQGHPG